MKEAEHRYKHSFTNYNYLGQRLQLQPNVRYTLIIKNGYILALRAGEKQLRLPNLVVA